MKLFKFMFSRLFQLISLLFLLLFSLGLLNIYFSDKNNYCLTTYMYEYPQFVPITLPENKYYPQYGLYAYSEGWLTERARNMWFDGVPVLYLPGNAGSHMQARSLASVALRKAISDGGDYHFDYFTVSFNEDLSGLYGGVLQTQTDFAAACVKAVLNLYKANKYTKAVPTSVIIVGHSMGGLIAKRLLAYPDTLHTTRIAITLASPLEAPVINYDSAIDNYYKLVDEDWSVYIRNNPEVKNKKVLLSFGNGPRDILIPSYLTSSMDSDINSLTTSIPGVWVSPDHVSIVWCKQLVMAINKFLFSVVDPHTDQIVDDKNFIMRKAYQYFQANRSMTLDVNIARAEVSMIADGFWYEDNRRIYQISRPDVDKTTYLMIRLVTFPQNRFVAVETVNVPDKDWIFGCSAMYTYGSHRYCKQATSLSELSRWTGAATQFGKRKLATVHLHDVMEKYPQWSHVIVRVSPTRRPIKLNVDINDLASRQLTVDLPSELSIGRTIIVKETVPSSLYYELVLPEFNLIHQAYYLYVEPVDGCNSNQYHVSAELHVPWAENHEYYHYFTPSKHTPMKLRLFKSNPNVTAGMDATLTLLLDPQCTFIISISPSWYYRLAQMVRNYALILVPYMAAIVLLATRSNLQHLFKNGTCVSIHNALMSEGVKPYYALVFSRLTTVVLASIPMLSVLFENASSNNLELHYVTRSLLVLPLYMVSLGMINAVAAAILAVMVFSSQLANRLLFRIIWRGGNTMAERVASGLQKVPILVSVGLICAVPLSCGAAALTAGAAFYAFMISNMFEEYLEDCVYKIMAKIGSRICLLFKRKRNLESDTDATLLEPTQSNDDNKNENSSEVKAIENKPENMEENESVVNKNGTTKKADKEEVDIQPSSSNTLAVKEKNEIIEVKINLVSTEGNNQQSVERKETDLIEVKERSGGKRKKRSKKTEEELDNELCNLNFHVMMFFLWLIVTLSNVPALLTWARNFKYSMVLKVDTSYYTGFIMSICSVFVWQAEGPRKKLKHYQLISDLLFIFAVLILAIGPMSITIVNYVVTIMFTLLTLQQILDKEIYDSNKDNTQLSNDDNGHDVDNQQSRASDQKKTSENGSENLTDSSENLTNENDSETNASKRKTSSADNTDDNLQEQTNCECSESRIYNVLKTVKEKLNLNDDNL